MILANAIFPEDDTQFPPSSGLFYAPLANTIIPPDRLEKPPLQRIRWLYLQSADFKNGSFTHDFILGQ